MLKTFITIFRGLAARQAEDVVDRHAIIILEQQIRDSGHAVEASRRALAVAIAQDRGEAKRARELRARIADLETRAVEAIKGGREDLAREAAEAIASLEADAAAAEEACRRFAVESQRLKRTLAKAEHRLSQLERGRRITNAAETVRRLRAVIGRAGITGPDSPLAEAEATLRRLEKQQAEDEATSEALESLDPAAASATISEKLAEQGFGPRLKPSPDDVLERLKKKAEESAASDQSAQ